MQRTLPHFGEINLEQLEEDYRITTATGIDVDLNFANTRMDAADADILEGWLLSIPQMNEQNWEAIREDFKIEGETVQEYVGYWMWALEEEELNSLIGKTTRDEEKPAALLSKLRLIRVGFYPDGKYGCSDYAVFDYGIDIDGEPQDQLLVVKRDAEREIVEIVMES